MFKGQALMNQRFFCDYRQDTLADWAVQAGPQRFEAEFVLSQEKDVILSFSEMFMSKGQPIGGVSEYHLDGRAFPCDWSVASTAYPGYCSICKSFEHRLESGLHRLRIEQVFNPALDEGRIIVYLHDAPTVKLSETAAERTFPYPAAPEHRPAPKPQPLDGWQVGCDEKKRSIGRFGFTKGDGLLDCAMPVLGCLTRMHLCGHPDYHKMHRWQYSLLPEGIDPEKRYHGSFGEAQVDWREDEVDIRYLGVSWSARFERPGREPVRFGCTYSLASAAIMVETDDSCLRLSDLIYAGNYSRLMLPLEKGLVIRDISTNDTPYSRADDGELAENFFLLFGAPEFPDIPIQVIMSRRPESIELRRRKGALSELLVNTSGAFGVGFVASPFGIESLSPERAAASAFVAEAYGRCHFWSRAALDYPVDAKEHYRIGEDGVEIAQRFQYLAVKDEWGTLPLRTAPLPPLTSITDGEKGFKLPAETEDFHFPTLYGFLRGLVGTDTSSYRLPLIPERRKFPLRSSTNDKLKDEIADGWEDYWNFQEKFAGGELADELYYPYPGAYLEKYMIPVWMFAHLGKDALGKLGARIAENLPKALDANGSYFYVKTDWGDLMKRYPDAEEILSIYTNPNRKRKKHYCWHDRVEPATGMKYKICYVNVCLANMLGDGERQTIADLKTPLIENDWGTGLAFTAIYLGTLLTDSWETLRGNWKVLRESFEYFRVLQDWCCMSSAYAENGRLWVEGANYGAFTAFARMAEELEDHDSLDLAHYIGAKQGAARTAIFLSGSRYFHKFLNCKPWYTTKVLCEEVNSRDGFLHVPESDKNNFNGAGIGNLSTEGIYPEIFMLLAQNCPEETAHVMELCKNNLLSRLSNVRAGNWGDLQTFFVRLLFLALDNRISMDELEQEIAFGDKHGVMLRKWRGIHCPPRYLPKNLLPCYLKALVATCKWPAWLETWRGLRLLDASFDEDCSTVRLEMVELRPGAKVELGVSKPPKQVLLDGDGQPFSYNNALRRLVVRPGKAGVLSVKF